MLYRITYKGEEVCRIKSEFRFTQQELLDFFYSDKKAAYESGVPGFQKKVDEYFFDYEYSDMKITPNDPDEGWSWFFSSME